MEFEPQKMSLTPQIQRSGNPPTPKVFWEVCPKKSFPPGWGLNFKPYNKTRFWGKSPKERSPVFPKSSVPKGKGKKLTLSLKKEGVVSPRVCVPFSVSVK